MRLNIAAAALLGAVALFMMGSPTGAQVPDPWASQLAQQLARHEANLEREGFERVGAPYSGGLGPGQAQRFNIMLHAGSAYRIVGVCDVDCRNLDMRLYDQNRNPISADNNVGRTAAVTSQPRWTGPFTVEIVMSHCAQAPCYFAFAIYRQ